MIFSYYNHATAYVCYLFTGIGYACYSLSFWNLAMYFVKLYLNKVEILKKIRPISKGKKAKIAKEVQPTQQEEMKLEQSKVYRVVLWTGRVLNVLAAVLYATFLIWFVSD